MKNAKTKSLPPTQRAAGPSLLAWGLMFVLAWIWGGSYLSNRIALEQMPVFSTVAFRVTGAALVLWPYIWLRGLWTPLPPKRLLALFGMGLLNNVIPMSLIVWGQQHIASGLAGILNASTAIFGVALAAFFFRDEKLGGLKALGVGTGFLGVVTVLGTDGLQGFDLGALSQWALIGASLSYALSSSFARATLSGLRPEVSAAGMLTAAGVVLIPLALIFEGMPHWAALEAPTWGALLYLALISSALAYVIFYQILALAGAGNQQLVTLLVAPVAVLLGALVYGEQLSGEDGFGFLIIALGLLLIDGRLPRRFWQGRHKGSRNAL
jgi:drug/metabolite transporter (DMT)-like permease